MRVAIGLLSFLSVLQVLHGFSSCPLLYGVGVTQAKWKPQHSSIQRLELAATNLRCSQTKRETLSKDLIELCLAGPKNGYGASEDQKASIYETASKLQQLNPSRDPAKSKVLDGNWKLIFSTTTGPSVGKLGPFLGDVRQLIFLDQGKYINELSFLDGNFQANLSARWKVIDDKKWNVIFDDICFRLFGTQIFRKEFDSSKRDAALDVLDNTGGAKAADRSARGNGVWDMAYTDENLRVLYAKGSQKDEADRGNIYILVRDS